MTDTNSGSRRRMPAAIAAVVLSAGLLVACGSTQSGASEQPKAPVVTEMQTIQSSHADRSVPMELGSRTASESAMYKGMQTLWLQHMQWTYATIAAFAVDSPGYPATVARLLANQEDIGNAVKQFYGDAAGDKLTALLKDHITGVAAILTAARAGDSAAQTEAVDAEYANARAIGDFLAAANPINWSRDSMEKMMEVHIDQTLVYATDLLTGKNGAAITHYGAAEAHMVEMSDMLSAGVIAQFPTNFSG